MSHILMRPGGTVIERVGEFLDGRRYKLDGIAGTFRATSFEAGYPYRHTVYSISHVPSAAGKKTEAYLKIRRELHDDWSTDLTDSDRLFEIAVKLGFKE